MADEMHERIRRGSKEGNRNLSHTHTHTYLLGAVVILIVLLAPHTQSLSPPDIFLCIIKIKLHKQSTAQHLWTSPSNNDGLLSLDG